MTTYRCPDCHQYAVTYQINEGRENHYWCEQCDWYAPEPHPGEHWRERQARRRLIRANPGISL